MAEQHLPLKCRTDFTKKPTKSFTQKASSNFSPWGIKSLPWPRLIWPQAPPQPSPTLSAHSTAAINLSHMFSTSGPLHLLILRTDLFLPSNIHIWLLSCMSPDCIGPSLTTPCYLLSFFSCYLSPSGIVLYIFQFFSCPFFPH